MELDRLNSPQTSAITLEALGHQLRFLQDPNSKHLGTTVWDASMVFAKFLEKNCRKGKFCHSKLKGKRVIELGAGCGVAGFGMAMLGCDVVLTDQKEVLSLLQRNVDYNTSSINQMNTSGGSFGSIKVAELDWGNMDQVQAADPPFDFIIGTDVVYAEHLLEPLLQTILALSGPRTTLLMGYEIRSTSVQEQMLQLFKSKFDVKAIPKAKMHSEYQHHSIQLYTMTQKPSPGINLPHTLKQREEDLGIEEVTDAGPGRRGPDNTQADCVSTNDDNGAMEVPEPPEAVNDLLPRRGELSEWEVRRYGSMAARLLRDIKITLDEGSSTA